MAAQGVTLEGRLQNLATAQVAPARRESAVFAIDAILTHGPEAVSEATPSPLVRHVQNLTQKILSKVSPMAASLIAGNGATVVSASASDRDRNSREEQLTATALKERVGDLTLADLEERLE